MPKFKSPTIQAFEAKNPNFRELINQKLEGQHFMRHIGFELTKIEAGLVEGEAKVKDFMRQQDGFMHGGLISTVADIVCGFSAFSLVPPNAHVVTAEIKVSFLSPGKGDYVFARGYVIKPGKRLNFCEGEVWMKEGEEEKLIARVYTTMASFIPGKVED